MNRRQAKKAYKKKYGHNPLKTEVRFIRSTTRKLVIKTMDEVRKIMPRAIAAIRKMCEAAVRVVNETTERIQTMPEEEFIQFLETSGLEESTKKLAMQLRMAGNRECG